MTETHTQERTEFSVVVPVYNHARYVRQAVASALRCALVKEVLLADDGSKDNSAEVISSLVAAYPSRVHDLTGRRRNEGAAARLNQLLQAARCEWVAVLNSDDVFVRGRFEAAAAEFQKGAYDFIFGNLLLMNEHGALVGAKRGPFDTGSPFPSEFSVEGMVRAGDLVDLLAHQNYLGTTSNMIFTRTLHARIGGFRDFRYVHDWDFALRAMVQGKVLYLSRYVTGYRLHPKNTILEDPMAVNAEAKSLFERLQTDIPKLWDRPGFRIGQETNVNLEPLSQETKAAAV